MAETTEFISKGRLDALTDGVFAFPMTLLVAPNTEHKLIPEYAKKAETEYAKHAGPGKGRPEHPRNVRFVTYTPHYTYGSRLRATKR